MIICADHGNDPCIGHSYHTREYVPIILIGKKIKNITLEKECKLSLVTEIIKSWMLNHETS